MKQTLAGFQLGNDFSTSSTRELSLYLGSNVSLQKENGLAFGTEQVQVSNVAGVATSKIYQSYMLGYFLLAGLIIAYTSFFIFNKLIRKEPISNA